MYRRQNSPFTGIALFLCLVLLAVTSHAQTDTVYLHKDWSFRQVGDTAWQRAQVPGVVHTDLFEQGMIPDPLTGCHADTLLWISEKDWEYRGSFRKADIAASSAVLLVFEGLDTYAEVFLNGRSILRADNMFVRWEVPLDRDSLQPDNELLIRFRSPLSAVSDASQKRGMPLPGGDWAFSRKAAYHFGWDWAPRLPTMGMWRPVYLMCIGSLQLERMHLVQESLTDSLAVLRLELDLRSDRDIREELTIKVQDGQETKFSRRERLLLGDGRYRMQLRIAIRQPKRWYPHTHGTPHLYQLKLQIGRDSQVISERLDFGLRSTELVTRADTAGRQFYFEVNGKPVFARGGNYVPQDVFLPRVSPEDYRTLLREVKDAGMNMLRVWGGGVYEDDLFYRLCDSLGILVWQDFMFACAMYPGDPGFLASVALEARQQVERLRKHPSIVLWCGNNEVDEAWHNWGWQKSYKLTPAMEKIIQGEYQALFHDLLPSICGELDDSRPYWPSSPSVGWGRPESYLEGDVHYWGVWWGMAPFSTYRQKTGRFVSEYGFQGIPDERTVAEFAPASGQPELEHWECHQKHPTGYETIATYMEREGMHPIDHRALIYWSQVLQAYGMAQAVEAHRQKQPYCMGSLYWQLNDCWPVVSWSGLDYRKRPKAFHYHLKRLMAAHLLSVNLSEDSLMVELTADRGVPADTRIVLRAWHPLGYTLWEDTLYVREQHPYTASIALAAPLQLAEEKFHITEARWIIADTVVARATYWAGLPGTRYYEDPGLEYVQIERGGRHFLQISCHRPARWVWIRETGTAGDNFFDLFPGELREIRIEPDHTPEVSSAFDHVKK